MALSVTSEGLYKQSFILVAENATLLYRCVGRKREWVKIVWVRGWSQICSIVCIAAPAHVEKKEQSVGTKVGAAQALICARIAFSNLCPFDP